MDRQLHFRGSALQRQQHNGGKGFADGTDLVNRIFAAGVISAGFRNYEYAFHRYRIHAATQNTLLRCPAEERSPAGKKESTILSSGVHSGLSVWTGIQGCLL